MTTLTDSQQVVLTSACQREDGLAALPAGTKPAAAAKLAANLISKGLVREIRSKPGYPVWREDEDGHGYSLKILKAGRDAIGVEEDEGDARASGEPAAPKAQQASPARTGSKRALVIGLLQRAKGATLDELVEATGWLPHTTRAAPTGLRNGEVLP
jgi:hypothetical protein